MGIRITVAQAVTLLGVGTANEILLCPHCYEESVVWPQHTVVLCFRDGNCDLSSAK